MAMIDSESRDMNWNLTDDQQMVRDMVREFVVAEVAPNAADWDRDKYFPSEMFEELGKLGLFGMVGIVHLLDGYRFSIGADIHR